MNNAKLITTGAFCAIVTLILIITGMAIAYYYWKLYQPQITALQNTMTAANSDMSKVSPLLTSLTSALGGSS